jgi:hypothetical protein
MQKNCSTMYINYNVIWIYWYPNLYDIRAFNIFQVYKYFTIYRRYFVLKFEHFRVYLMQYSLKWGGTKYHCRWVEVPGTASYKACNVNSTSSYFIISGFDFNKDLCFDFLSSFSCFIESLCLTIFFVSC